MGKLRTMYNIMKKGGLTDEAIVAFFGNWQWESGLEACRVEGDFTDGYVKSHTYVAQVTSGAYSRQQFVSDAKGFGLAQWTYYNKTTGQGRKVDLYDFWRRSNKLLDDYQMQTEFCIWELNNVGEFLSVGRLAKSSHDLYSLVSDICRLYEKPAYNNIQDRYNAALMLQAQLASDTSEDTTPTPNVEPANDQKDSEEDPIEKVLTLARNEVGYYEKASNAYLDDKTANAGAGNWTKYARDLDGIPNFYNGKKNGYAWCDVFYDWLLVQCFGAETGMKMLCQPYGSCGAGCLYSMQYYQSAGRFFYDPQPGDQIFFSYQQGEISHTGIVESVNGDTVNTIEGNVAEQVARRSYNRYNSVIVGYGRPKWDLAPKTVPVNPSGGGDDDSHAKIPATSYWPPRLLKVGMQGKDVEVLQVILKAREWHVVTIDGIFSSELLDKVKDFQAAYRLEVDGEVGPMTWGKLLSTERTV